MHCDYCGELFEYNEDVVALRESGTGVQSEMATEKEAGMVEGLEGLFEPVGVFHFTCYERRREAQPDESPPVP